MKTKTDVVIAFGVLSAFVGLFLNTAMLLAIFLMLMGILFEVEKIERIYKDKEGNWEFKIN